MPALRANALHPTQIGIATGRTVHHRSPIVKISVNGHISTVVIRIVTICCGFGEFCANGDDGSIGVVYGAQVLLQPALLPDFDGGIDAAVVIGHRVNTAVERRLSGKRQFYPVNRADTVGGIRAHIVGGVGCQSRNMACENTEAVAVIGMAVIECRVLCRAPADTPVGHVRPAGGRHLARDRGLGSLDIHHIQGKYGGHFRLRIKIEHIPVCDTHSRLGVCLIVVTGGQLQIGDGVVKRTVARADRIIHCSCH